MSNSSMKVFSGNPGYAGFYGPSTEGNNVTMMIARSSDVTGPDGTVDVASFEGNVLGANSGFLADAYSINWGRAVNVRRVFNNNKPIAVVGFGQGTISLQGLLGTYVGFKNILGGGGDVSSTNGNQDLCNPLVICIYGSGTYNNCADWEVQNTDGRVGVNFILTGCLVSNIQVTGQIESQSGALLQQANVTFSVGGFEIKPAK